MAEMKRVALDDMRTDPNNPRKEFDGLEQLSESFECTPGRPGEPVNPPIVVQDGNVYRIVDGERRFRAMCINGTPDGMCLCCVFDDYSDASSMAAMMATDSKKSLTEIERSVGVQQMLILGVPDDDIDKLSMEKKGTASRMRRAIESQSRPVQLSMDVLMEVSSIDDDAMRCDLMKLAEKDGSMVYSSPFRSKLRECRQEQDHNKEIDRFLEVISELGIELFEEAPDKDDGWTNTRSAYGTNYVRDVVEKLEEIGCEWKAFLEVGKRTGSGYYEMNVLRFYTKPTEEEDEERAERERRKAMESDFDARFKESKVSRLSFIASLVEDGSLSGLPVETFVMDACKLFFENATDSLYINECELFEKGVEAISMAKRGKVCTYEMWALPIFLYKIEPRSAYLFDVCMLDRCNDASERMTWPEYLEALVKSGYEVSDFEKNIVEKCTGVPYGQWLEEI